MKEDVLSLYLTVLFKWDKAWLL